MPYYCRMVGLPYSVTMNTINRWFQENGARDVEVHIIMNRENRPSGMGFVVLGSSEDVDIALSMDGQTVGGNSSERYVKMHSSDENEFNWYLNRQQSHRDSDQEGPLYLVRLRGVPFKVNEYEIVAWFRKGCGAEPTDVQCGTSRNTHGLANAFFRSHSQAQKALAMDKADMEGRYIELSMDQVPVTFDDEGHNPCTLRMMGVPYKTNTQELKDFFADHAECLDVRVLLNRDGFPSGDAVAFFADEDAVGAAMECNKKDLGKRYVVLQPNGSSRGGGGGGDRNGGRQGDSRGRYNDSDESSYAVKMNGLPYEANEDDVHSFFGEVDAKVQSVRFMKNRSGRNSGEAVVTFTSQKDVDAALTRNRAYMGARYVIINQTRDNRY